MVSKNDFFSGQLGGGMTFISQVAILELARNMDIKELIIYDPKSEYSINKEDE